MLNQLLSFTFPVTAIAEMDQSDALPLIDQMVKNELNRSRIWLEVFETNTRAKRVYEQFGYRKFGKTDINGKKLLLYEKQV